MSLPNSGSGITVLHWKMPDYIFVRQFSTSCRALRVAQLYLRVPAGFCWSTTVLLSPAPNVCGLYV